MATNNTRHLKEFKLQLKEEADKAIEQELSKFVRAITLEVLRRLVLKSPVDTGLFRGNWNVGIGTPDLSTREVIDKQGSETITRGLKQLTNIPAFVQIWVSNNLPYAEAIEHGRPGFKYEDGRVAHSAQAPKGVVALTLAEIEGWMERNRP